MIWSICRRDLIASFTAPMAWLVLACWSLLVNGVFLWTLYNVHGTPGAQAPLYTTPLNWGVFFLVLLAPAVTMGSFTQERAQGTMQLLLTVPVREYQLVLGKFLAAFGVLLSLVVATLVQPLVLLFISEVALPHLLAGYCGLVLACALFAALGIWISLLVDTVIAAYVITFAAIAVLVLLGALGDQGWYGAVGKAMGLAQRAGPFFRGELRLGNVAWFLGLAAGALVMAHSALSARRIHG
jgi:ABC-2 type transport system permease protein